MSELLLVLFILGTVLIILALVGHGLWLIFAWLIRLVFGGGVPEGQTTGRRCPGCGRALSPADQWCSGCGWEVAAAAGLPASMSPGDLRAMLRQLDRFRESGAIEPATYEAVMRAIAAERQRLEPAAVRGGPAAVPRAAEPIVLPPAPLAPPASTGRQAPPVRADLPSAPVTAFPVKADAVSPAAPDRVVFPAAQASVPPAPQHPPAALGRPLEPPPRKPFSEVLAAFMEAKNIRWGELVGGLLIIGCSIALVFSLWSTISETPILKYFLFTGVTSAFFGVGLYTEHRWKLPTTSYGVLIIAILLVPLNLLAIAAFSRGMSSWDLQVLASEFIAIGAFAYLTQRSGRVIVPGWSWPLTAGVLGSSAAQFAIRRFGGPDSTIAAQLLLGSVPLLFLGGATAWMLRDVRRCKEVGESESNSVFTLLGSVSFAVLLAIGFLIYHSGRPLETLRNLAPLVSLGGIPAMASGLVLWQQVAAGRLVTIRTAALSIAVLGAFALLGGVVLAWPKPVVMLPVAVLDFVALTVVALVFGIPAAHLLATACLVFAYLIALQVVRQRVDWVSDTRQMLGAIFSAASGSGLVALVVLLGAASELWRRVGRALDAYFYRIATGAVVLLSLALVTGFGFGRSNDPGGVTVVYALYAVAAFAMAWHARSWQLTWAATALSLAAITQAFVFRFGHGHDPYYWQLAMVVHATAAAVAATAVRQFHPTLRQAFADPLSLSAVASSWLATPFWLYAAPTETTGMFAAMTLWIAASWFALSYLHRLAGLFTAAQCMLALGVAASSTAWAKSFVWYATLAHPLLDPWVLQIQGISLALLSLAWIAVRIGFRMRSSEIEQRLEGGQSVAPVPSTLETVRWLLYPPWPPVDRLFTALLLMGLVGMAVYAVVPGVLQEMAPAADHEQVLWSIAGVSHAHAAGAGTWVLWSLLLVVLITGFWEQFDAWLVYGLIVTLAAACPLAAVRWGGDVATASALRWIIAGFLVLGSIPIWMRSHVHRMVLPFGWRRVERGLADLARDARLLLLTIALTPVLGLTIYPAMATIFGRAPAPMPADSFFGQVGDSVSYVVPLALVFVSLVGHGVRERSAGFAFSGGLVLNLAVTLGYLLDVVKSGGRPADALVLVRLFQLNGLATAGFALAWLGSRGWLLRVFTGREAIPAGGLLKLQVVLAVGIQLFLLVPADLWLFWSPTSIAAWLAERGSLLGWISLGTALAACVGLMKSAMIEVGAGAVGLCILAVGSAVAFSMCHWDSGYSTPLPPALGIRQSAPWLGYHTLLACRVAGAWLVMILGRLIWLRRDSSVSPGQYTAPFPASFANWSAWTGGLGVILSLRNALDVRDLTRPWWPLGALVATSVLMATLAHWTLVRRRVYWAGILGNLAATSWCIVELWPARGHILDTVHVNVMTLALPAVAWLVLDVQVFRRAPGDRSRSLLLAFHHVAAIGSLAVMCFIVALGLLADSAGHPITGPLVALGWAAFASVGVVVAACLWDDEARYAMPALYMWGLVLIGMMLDRFDLQSQWLGWTGVIILAAYSIATSYLWSQRDGLRALADLLRIPRRDESPLAGPGWLLVANQVLAVAVVVLAYWIVLTFDRIALGIGEAGALSLRLTAAKAAMGQALAVGLLARGSRRTQLQYVSLWLVVIGAIAWGWAWLDPLPAGNLLNRAVVVLSVLGAMAALYGIGLTKVLRRENEWTRAAERLMPSLAALCALSLTFILAVEISDQIRIGRVEMAGLAILVVAVTLVGLSVSGLVLAVFPGRDPFRLSERGRMLYVYAAELLLGLVFMHIRLTKPEWFGGFFEQFWPLIVLGIAYLGVGLSELFERQKRLVLAEPLHRTGTLLPVLPVLGFWALPYHVHFSLVLVCIGFLYGVLSVTRKSFGFGVLASLAANGGLVYLLNHDLGYSFFEHAQLWLIPGALSVLTAAYLNRDELSDEQFVAIRYVTVMVIYVSSTADIFLTGVRAAPWLPLVLSLLSVAGIFGGIMLRVRAFLFLGSSFLVLSLVTMILSAHLNLGWTWLWWVAGISLGVAIIAVFALFEKKRNEMLQVVDGLKQWER